MTIGDKIRDTREGLGLSLNDVIARSGHELNRQTIVTIESNVTKNPGIITVMNILNALGTDHGKFLKSYDHETKQVA